MNISLGEVFNSFEAKKRILVLVLMLFVGGFCYLGGQYFKHDDCSDLATENQKLVNTITETSKLLRQSLAGFDHAETKSLSPATDTVQYVEENPVQLALNKLDSVIDKK